MSENQEQRFLARVQKEGRITIPKLVRKILKLREGQNVEVTVRVITKKE